MQRQLYTNAYVVKDKVYISKSHQQPVLIANMHPNWRWNTIKKLTRQALDARIEVLKNPTKYNLTAEEDKELRAMSDKDAAYYFCPMLEVLEQVHSSQNVEVKKEEDPF